MKKTSLLFLSFFLANILVFAKQYKVTVSKPGSLSAVLPGDATDATISGSINGTDIKYLRQLILEKDLSSLDLSGVSIVSGGEPYYEEFTTQEDMLGSYSFVSCPKLTNCILPKGIKSIGERAFSWCDGLTKIVIPENVISLGFDAFAYCSNLEEVTVGKHVKNYNQGVFWGSNVKNAYIKSLSLGYHGAYIFSSLPTIHVFPEVLEEYIESDWTEFGNIVGDLDQHVERDPEDMDLVYLERLSKYFEDDACTVLKEKYASMNDEELVNGMNDVPDYISAIALKVKNNDWKPYEKDFRINSYIAYSDANNWRQITNSNGGSYMGNPTGIYSNTTQYIYVFVDNDVPEDATLYIAGCSGNNLIENARTGTKLKRGANLVTAYEDELLYILYTANTTSMTKTIDEWPEIKIHIEGGIVNGYYDMSRHTPVDYQAILSSATHERFTVKGSTSLFNFKTEAYRRFWPTEIDRSINWFDSLTVCQFEVMGICESVATGKRNFAPYNMAGGDAFYPNYYNNPNFAIQGEDEDGGWANASVYRTSYNGFDCVNSSFNVYSEEFDEWCAAHETGHQNQDAISVEGCAEVSNNLFSNIARFLSGRRETSGHTLTMTNSDFQNHKPFFTRDIFSMTRMYYQLYLYYHQARRNTSFYPTLFKELRKDPLREDLGPNECALKFVRKVCQVANEDLTDFFRVWGFLEPCDVTVDDYGMKHIVITQEDIDATMEEISRYPRKNREILLIDDRIKPMEQSGFLGTSGRYRVDPDEELNKPGELGQFSDYLPGAIQSSSYSYIQIDSLFVMKGTGGVGFIVLDDDDNLLFFSNSIKMELPKSVTQGNYTIYSIDADGTLNNVVRNNTENQTVNVTTAGTLSTLLTNEAINVTITGYLNGTDIKYLRSLINDYNLMCIDMSGARIVSGGDAYYESYYTQDDVITDCMFYECKNLRIFKLPLDVTKLHYNAFSESGLIEIDIPDQVAIMDYGAFGGCTDLKKVAIGKNIKEVGWYCFFGASINDVYVKALDPPAIYDAFTEPTTIHVYPQSLEAYLTSEWAKFGFIVGDLSDEAVDIETINQDYQHSKNYHNLLGTKVKNITKGTIYIIDGKKVIY